MVNDWFELLRINFRVGGPFVFSTGCRAGSPVREAELARSSSVVASPARSIMRSTTAALAAVGDADANRVAPRPTSESSGAAGPVSAVDIACGARTG